MDCKLRGKRCLVMCPLRCPVASGFQRRPNIGVHSVTIAYMLNNSNICVRKYRIYLQVTLECGLRPLEYCKIVLRFQRRLNRGDAAQEGLARRLAGPSLCLPTTTCHDAPVIDMPLKTSMRILAWRQTAASTSRFRRRWTAMRLRGVATVRMRSCET
ncbi:hypothetical protein LIA77_10952 [Sarocladium implicatum]|nr:hypothetical protein LIA77_10952 [Sarocladium implicatum]